MRICSLLPSATEIVYAVGRGEDLVAVTHECDHPPEVAGKPRITRSILDDPNLLSAEIDRRIAVQLARGEGVYQLDRELLAYLQPDLILTQELCTVCAVSYGEVASAVQTLPRTPKILSLEPKRLEEILDSIRLVGEAVGAEATTEDLIAGLWQRVEEVTRRLSGVTRRPKVLALEWLEPPMASGYWTPELVELAGGCEVLGRAGEPSRKVSWADIAQAAPEVVVVMPCGFPVARTLQELEHLALPDLWQRLPAVAKGKVFVVDGNALFNRPGPRIVDSLELLAQVLHPDRFPELQATGHESRHCLRVCWPRP